MARNPIISGEFKVAFKVAQDINSEGDVDCVKATESSSARAVVM